MCNYYISLRGLSNFTNVAAVCMHVCLHKFLVFHPAALLLSLSLDIRFDLLATLIIFNFFITLHLLAIKVLTRNWIGSADDGFLAEMNDSLDCLLRSE